MTALQRLSLKQLRNQPTPSPFSHLLSVEDLASDNSWLELELIFCKTSSVILFRHSDVRAEYAVSPFLGQSVYWGTIHFQGNLI